jgi:hypothetical protein
MLCQTRITGFAGLIYASSESGSSPRKMPAQLIVIFKRGQKKRPRYAAPKLNAFALQTTDKQIAKSGCSWYYIRTYPKNKISVQGKARNGEKAEHTRSM